MYRIKLALIEILALAIVGLSLWLLAGDLPFVKAVSENDITFTQRDSQLIISINNAENSSLLWHYAQITNSNDCEADFENLFLAISRDDSADNQVIITLTPKTSRFVVCLKIVDETNNDEIFQAFQPQAFDIIDNQAPTINIQRTNNSTINISSRDTDLDVTSWAYGQFRRNPNCRAVAIDTALPTANAHNLTLTEDNNNIWLCFSVQDQSGNRAYAEYKVEGVDTSAPILKAQQDGRVLKAESDEQVSGWIYVFSPSDITCNSNTFLNNRSTVNGQEVILTTDRINYYYCFRATDSGGNPGFVKYHVASVDFLATRIRLEQDGLKILATSDKPLSSWHYVRADAEISCNTETNFEEANDFSNKRAIDLTTDDHQHFFCVRGVNKTNTASFAIIEVNAQAPTVDLKIKDDVIKASASGDDLSWRYFKIEDQPDCDDGDQELFESASFDKYQGNTSQLNKLDNDLWFCFQAIDDFGNAGYAKTQISGITSEAPGDEQGQSRGQRDIIILVLTSLTIGAGLIVFFIIKKRHRKASSIDPFLTTSGSRLQKHKQSKKQKETDGEDDDSIQPLNYLKGDDDE